jgi:hypothetical protein
VTGIESFSFAEQEYLEDVDILQASITHLWGNTFTNCTSLKSLTIPHSVGYIFSTAFSGCTNLETLIYNGTTAEWQSITKVAGWNNDILADTVQLLDNPNFPLHG